MIRVLILGAGGHGQVVADILLCAHQAGSTAAPIGFLDDAPDLIGQSRLGLPILGDTKDIDQIEHDAILIGIGNNLTRKRLFEHLQDRGEHFVTAIHPRAIIARDVQTCPGTIIAPGVIVNTGAQIGANIILNTGCTIDHHNRIGDHVHIAPGAHLGGDVSIGTGALVGIGATVMPQKTLGAWAVAGAGAVITRDIPDHTTVVGIPAKEIKRTSL